MVPSISVPLRLWNAAQGDATRPLQLIIPLLVGVLYLVRMLMSVGLA